MAQLCDVDGVWGSILSCAWVYPNGDARGRGAGGVVGLMGKVGQLGNKCDFMYDNV